MSTNNIVHPNELLDRVFVLENRLIEYNEEWKYLVRALEKFTNKVNNDYDGLYFNNDIDLESIKNKISLSILDTFHFSIEKTERLKSFSVTLYEVAEDEEGKREVKSKIADYRYEIGNGWNNGVGKFSERPSRATGIIPELLSKLLDHVGD